MTQPAKVQEPSMEEILASIRRIIADDEAKPAAAEKPASPAAAAKPAVMKDIPPSAIAPAAQACSRAEAGSAACPCARTGRQQQPGRHRRHAGGPRRGDARSRDQAGAPRTGAGARAGRVRTHRRNGGAGAATGQPSTRSSLRTTSNSPKPERLDVNRIRRSRARQQDPFYRIRPSPPWNPPSTRWPIPS